MLLLNNQIFGPGNLFWTPHHPLQAETRAQIARIEADGGTIIDVYFMDSIIRTMKTQGIYDSAAFIGDANIAVKKDGAGAVATLYDISGNNNDAVQGVGAAQPIWTAAQQNGKAGLVFDGIDDFWEIGNSLVSAYPATFLTMVKASDGRIVDIALSTATKVNYDLKIVSSKARCGARSGGTSFFAVSTTTITDSTAAILMGEFLTDRTRNVWVDGVNEGNDATAISFVATDRTSLGRAGDSTPDSYLSGTFFSAMISGAILTTTQRQAVETLINNYYAVYGA